MPLAPCPPETGCGRAGGSRWHLCRCPAARHPPVPPSRWRSPGCRYRSTQSSLHTPAVGSSCLGRLGGNGQEVGEQPKHVGRGYARCTWCARCGSHRQLGARAGRALQVRACRRGHTSRLQGHGQPKGDTGPTRALGPYRGGARGACPSLTSFICVAACSQRQQQQGDPAPCKPTSSPHTAPACC